MPRLPIAPDLLPVRRVAELLLGPAALALHGSVAVARTARHWELNLGRLAGRELPGDDSSGRSTADADESQPSDPGVDLRDLMRPGSSSGTDRESPDASDLPVEGWAELSPQAADAALADLGADDLDLLLVYEQSHGHRPAYLLLLQRRRETVAS